MARFFRLTVLVGLAAALAVPAFANIPDAGLSTVPGNLVLYQRSDVIVPPNTSISVNIQGAQGPVNGANVEIRVSAFADPLACWCVSNGFAGDAAALPQAHPIVSGTTDILGNVSFTILGGGCVDPARLGEVVADVLADGIPMAQIGMNSPDAVNGSGDLPTEDGYVAPAVCETALSDGVFHTGPIANALPEFCTDLDGDGAVGGPDAVLLTPSITNAASCTP